MNVNIRKWGNSLGVRMPNPIAKALNLSEGIELKVSIEDGRIIMEPAKTVRYDLDQLLENIDASNLHEESSTGYAKGKEQW